MEAMVWHPRQDGDGAIHHVMNRGVNHQRIFFGDPDRIEFGERLADIHERFGVETLAYALMTNHYHLLLRTPHGGLSEAMHRLGLVFVKRTNDRVGRDGPLFRARFRSIRVTTDAYLACATRYIHRNPLDLPGVTRASDYRWSSDRAYRALRPVAPFLNTSLVLSLFGHEPRSLARFTDGEHVLPHNSAGVSADDVRQLVELFAGAHDLSTGEDEVVPRWLERTAMLAVAETVHDERLGQDIVNSLGFSTSGAERMARMRAREREVTPVLRRVVAQVLAAMSQERRAA